MTAPAMHQYPTVKRWRECVGFSISSASATVPGERTGKFRLGRDQLLTNDKGSSISFEDYAIALADEIERPAHRRQHFTVGY